MIGEEWLKQLRIELGEGYRIEGVYVGGAAAVLHVIDPNGEESAYRFPRHLFRFPAYIQEVPNWLVPIPHYDVHRLNRKLANLLGDPEINILIRRYDLLFHFILEFFYKIGESNLDSVTTELEEFKKIWRFIIRTPAISYRLSDYATSNNDQQRRAWAEQALVELKRLGPGDPDLAPETLYDNPLLIWAGAVSEGFFTKSELPEAVSAMERHLFSLPEEQIRIFLSQMYALMSLFHSIEGLDVPTSISVFLDTTGLFQEQFATEEERNSPDGLGTLLEGIRNRD